MKLPPLDFKPGPNTFYNGMPARFLHAGAVDEYATWQQLMRQPIPAYIGSPLQSGQTYDLIIPDVPAYTPYLAIGLTLCGRGSIAITSAADSTGYNTTIAVDNDPGTSPTFAKALPYWLADTMTTPGADGKTRALKLTDQSSPQDVDLAITITDESGSEFLYCYQVVVYPLPRQETATLPS